MAIVFSEEEEITINAPRSTGPTTVPSTDNEDEYIKTVMYHAKEIHKHYGETYSAALIVFLKMVIDVGPDHLDDVLNLSMKIARGDFND